MFKKDLKEAGIKCNMDRVMEFLDERVREAGETDIVFYAPEGVGGILKSNRLSVRPSVSQSVTNHVSAISPVAY